MIRELRGGDVPAVGELRRLAFPPDLPASDLLLRHELESAPARAQVRWWVAEEDGEIVGAANGRFRWSSSDAGSAKAWAVVRPDRRGRGIGGELFALAEEHVRLHGATSIDAEVFADPAGERFLRRRGYAAGRSDVHSVLDVAGADLSAFEPLQAALGEFRLVPLGELRDKPRDLWRLDLEGVTDIPADAPNSRISFEEWRRDTFELPEIADDGSFVAVHGDELVAYAWLRVDGERAENEMTGTRAPYRRRGLARLVKLAATQWARDAGVRTIATSNDTENTGMLALNAELGYRRVLTSTELNKRLA